jgi:hypothetical protein
MTHVFDNPQQFISHLETRLADIDRVPDSVKISLLHGSLHALRYLEQSQDLIAQKMLDLVSCLNQHHPSWGHKLAELYAILEAGQISAEQMNQILRKEVLNEQSDQD